MESVLSRRFSPRKAGYSSHLGPYQYQTVISQQKHPLIPTFERQRYNSSHLRPKDGASPSL